MNPLSKPQSTGETPTDNLQADVSLSALKIQVESFTVGHISQTVN